MEAFLASRRERLKGLEQEIAHHRAEITWRRGQIKALWEEVKLERKALRSAERSRDKAKPVRRTKRIGGAA